VRIRAVRFRQEELVARAKRTDRTEARRRHRAEQANLAAGEPETGAETPATTGAKSTARPAPQPRPSITAAFRGAVRPLDLRGDLRATRQVLTNWGFLAAMALTAAGAAWFVLTYNEAMAAIPVGTATPEQLQAVVSGNSIPFFIGQMAFLTPPPAVGAFLIGFAAKRASWLGGLVYGAFVTALVAILVQMPAGRLLTSDVPGATSAALIAFAAWSPVPAALFASAAAWYRRFLDLANPNRAAQRSQARTTQRRGNLGHKPAR
jgi:hypothetical protein